MSQKIALYAGAFRSKKMVIQEGNKGIVAMNVATRGASINSLQPRG